MPVAEPAHNYLEFIDRFMKPDLLLILSRPCFLLEKRSFPSHSHSLSRKD
jgi:hypothetical protein